ncbi:hypothetical protein IJI31_01820 [bacterium]|nr:hypothetical protein [bacterium]
MSSFAMGFTPFFYTSNEMPGWYQITNAGARDFRQMSLGCLALDGYNIWSYNQQSTAANTYNLSLTSIWNNMALNLCGLANRYGSYVSGFMGNNSGLAGSAGNTGAAGLGNTGAAGLGNAGAAGTAGSGNNDALKKAQEEADKAKKEAEAQRKAAEEYKQKYEELKKGKG